MKCFVCGSDMNHYFDKNFGQEISGTQEKHEFVKCCNCGMVVDKFLYDIPKKDWEELNFSNHKSYHENYTVPEEDEVDPKWKERIKDQIRTLKEFLDPSFIPKSASIVDFGCGNGMLADGFNGRGTAYEIKKYEKYMASIFPEKDYLTDDELKETS